MASQNPAMEVMAAVPAAVRGRIVSGMRWTFWLSALAVPFSYGTSILLARVGPEVIGTYGLLMVYIGIVASLFYFGGDAVVIKFVPALNREKRLAFLISYTAIVLGFVIVGIAIAAAWPRGLHYLFGETGGARFQLEMLCLSPIYILLSLVVAAHKAVLEMRWAHLLVRVLTIGSFAVYGLLYVCWHGLLAAHYVGLIWGVYLGFTTIATVLGLRHLLLLDEWRSNWRHFHFCLPKTFWHYCVTTEEVSLAGFVIQRLDLILVMNLGGITLLGKYVTVLTVAEALRTANKFFLDTLLPSLTNIISSGNMVGASQVVAMNLRLLFLLNFAGMGVLILLIDPIIHLFGPQYDSLRPLFIVAVLLFGLAAPGAVGVTLLSSAGRQYWTFRIYIIQIIVFTALFVSLWSRWNLLGAVVSVGLSTILASFALLIVGRSSTSLKFGISQDYGAFAAIGATAGLLSIRAGSWNNGIEWAVWLGLFGLLVFAGRYTLNECRAFLRCFLPASLGSMVVDDSRNLL